MHAYRRFCNKVWQATKYTMGKLPPDFAPAASLDVSKLSVPEKWILHRMNTAIKGVNEALAAREFSKTTQLIYQFFYDELCDVFIENSKAILTDGSARSRTARSRRSTTSWTWACACCTPSCPSSREELWQRLPRRAGDSTESIMVAAYPEYDAALAFEDDARDYELGLRCAEGIRSLAAEYGVKTGGHAYVRASTAESYGKATEQAAAVKALAGRSIAEVDILGAGAEMPRGCAVFVISSEMAVSLDVAANIQDVAKEITKVQAKLKKSQVAAEKQRELLEKEGFEEKASDARARGGAEEAGGRAGGPSATTRRPWCSLRS